MTESGGQHGRRGRRGALGPAIIVAAVVLGPGSILTSSKVGARYGYDLLWVLVLAVVLMIGMTALGARLGVGLRHTLCEELAQRAGRPLAVLVGLTMFVVIACFQASNNLGVLAALEPLAGTETLDGTATQAAVLLLLNGVIVATLCGLRRLYRPIERLMVALVLAMIFGFAGNLLFAQPDVGAVLGGLVPTWPDDADTILPTVEDGAVRDSLWAVQALVATTFSVAAAFYQAYLVREKGWTADHLSRGLYDSIVGISVLGAISLVIMVTSAATFHGRVDPDALGSAADVAGQLEPLFGSASRVLFGIGIFAGAFSSFLVNAMIGGTMLADGLGLGGGMDQRWPRWFTIAALTLGMSAAVAARWTDVSVVDLIVFAQALTTFGVPLLALSMLFLARTLRVPGWVRVLAWTGCAVSIALSLRTAWRLWLTA